MTSSLIRFNAKTVKARATRRVLTGMTGRVAAFGLGLMVSSLPASAGSALMSDPLSPTPLVLKDGRIAQVSVHSIPFPKDAANLSSNMERDLESFTQTIATDCFLTAQIIGHVGRKETRDRETLAIHRLARARADTIQKSLVGHGLPADSIASVWDWKFIVRDARATLWVFRLTAGDDCENKALGSGKNDLIADAGSSGSPTEETIEAAQGDIVVDDEESEQAAPVAHRIVAAARPTKEAVTRPLPASGPKSADKADAQKPSKSAWASGDAKSAPTQLAAVNRADPVLDKTGQVSTSENGMLEIIFATNSSYFPKGAGDQLRAFLKALKKGDSYRIRIQTSVDGDAAVSGASSVDEAVRYNTWLANRRFERVKSWLMKNAGDHDLQIESILLENDQSRRVRVQANPLG